MSKRFSSLQGLASKTYDVLVIGGGITGAGIARELSLRGISVLLVDKGDFGQGTSSVSTKLIHGGLRYLEKLQFKLVYESLKERFFLLQNAPHLVKKTAFLLPFYLGSTRAKWFVRLGLFFYDLLSIFYSIGTHKVLSRKHILDHIPFLNSKGLKGGALFFDAQMDDSRFCLEVILQAQQFGASVFNYVELNSINENEDNIFELNLIDKITNKSLLSKAKFVVNASGPWVSSILKLKGIQDNAVISPVKGTHLYVNKLIETYAILGQSQKDDRVFFIIPWGKGTLIGTTESLEKGDIDKLSVDSKDVTYLLDEVNKLLPTINLTKKDVLVTFAGIRPLVHSSKTNLNMMSRDHQIVFNQSNFLSVFGGKYTTFRLMSVQAAKAVCGFFRKPFNSKESLKMAFYGGDIKDVEAFIEKNFFIESNIYPISKEIYSLLVSRYGSAYTDVMAIIFEDPKYKPFLKGTSYLVGELVYSIRYEFTLTLVDFFRRRTKLFFEKNHGLDCLDEVITIFQKELNWTSQESDFYETEYRELLIRSKVD